MALNRVTDQFPVLDGNCNAGTNQSRFDVRLLVCQTREGHIVHRESPRSKTYRHIIRSLSA